MCVFVVDEGVIEGSWKVRLPKNDSTINVRFLLSRLSSFSDAHLNPCLLQVVGLVVLTPSTFMDCLWFYISFNEHFVVEVEIPNHAKFWHIRMLAFYFFYLVWMQLVSIGCNG